MPAKALVAFGVVLGFGLSALSVPAWCADANPIGQADGRSTDAAPITAGEQVAGSTTPLPVLTLDEVLTLTLKQSPKLSAFSLEVRARESEARQAGFRPNPEFSVEMENFAGSGDFSGTDSAETTVRISQLVELGGKRARRLELGRLEQEQAEREYEIVRAEVLSKASERFAAVLAAQRRLSLAGEEFELNRKVLQTVEDRIAAGKTAAIERVRIQTRVADARLRLEQARQELTAARRVLASAWGGEEAEFASVQGAFEEVRGVPELSVLTSRLFQSPEFALRRSAARRADRVLSLERAQGVPDLTLSLGARNDRDSGDNALVAELSMPLPVFDRNQGAVAAARARKAKAEEEARSVQILVRSELAESWQKLNSACSEVSMLREEILPASRKAFDAVVYGYQAGKFGLLEVLDAERTLFEAKSRYVDALASYHQAVSELERLLGQKLYAEIDDFDPTENERGQS